MCATQGRKPNPYWRMSQMISDILFKAQTIKIDARFMTKKTNNLIETHKSY